MRKLILLLVLLTTVTVVTAQTRSSEGTMTDKNSSSNTYSMNHPLHAKTGVSRDITSVIISDGKNQYKEGSCFSNHSNVRQQECEPRFPDA